MRDVWRSATSVILFIAKDRHFLHVIFFRNACSPQIVTYLGVLREMAGKLVFVAGTMRLRAWRRPAPANNIHNR